MRRLYYLRVARRKRYLMSQYQAAQKIKQIYKNRPPQSAPKRNNNSNGGRGRRVWGPLAWNLIHTFAQACPDDASPQNIQQYKKLMNSLSSIIPCPMCKQHCLDNLRRKPMNFTNKDEMVNYFMDFHNLVNSQLRKHVKLNRKQVDELYQNPNHNKLKNFINYWKRLLFEYQLNFNSFRQFLSLYIFLYPGGAKKTKLYNLCKKYPLRSFFMNKTKNRVIARWFNLTLDRI